MEEYASPPPPPRRPRSQSYDVTTPSSRASVSPPTPVGGAGSDVESTDAEWSVTSHSGGNLRSRSKSGDEPAARSWKSFSVRRLFRSKSHSLSTPEPEVFFLWDDLPECVQFGVVSFLSTPEILSLALVSRDVYAFARSDILWRPLFFSRFKGVDGAVVTLATDNFYHEYCERLTDPRPGDCVEVAWEGAFNLLCHESVTTYEGRAWWSATIVERWDLLYKIHYPQWDASVWDEWVPRHRVRWPARTPDSMCPVFKGDLVEHHCQSSHGISPWLEACVSDVTPDGVRLGGGVIRTEPKRVVPRESVRLIQRGRGRLFRRLRLAAGHSKCSIM